MNKFLMTSSLFVATVLSAHGATMCSGTSESVTLDLATGTRTTAASETIRYSTAWVDGAASEATAVVSVNGEAMKSGAITHEQSSVLSTTVMGPGTLSFSRRTSCEQDDDYEWDHVELAVDGVVKLRLNGVTAWTVATTEITGDGAHVIEWRYIKDEVESKGEDAAWVANYSWASAWTATRTTEVPVTYAWLTAHDPDVVLQGGGGGAVGGRPAR